MPPTPLSPSAEKGLAARRKLTSAAAALIGELGWTAVSTRQIAERAGVRPGIVHYHFPSIKALLAEAALATIEPIVAAALPALTDATPTEALDALVQGLDAYRGTDPASLVFTEMYLAAARDPELRERMAGVMHRFKAALTGCFGDEATATVVMAVLDGFVLQRTMDPSLRAASLVPVLRRILPGGVS
ncbi:TetR family transcriptional regulator [Actinorhabdospora filicis]|uniref:TetR family transcriptional regulator n=1 Tax=Actinorhabdospora filicis TaxID=1785913 RepID=A0A9W6SIV1_9ACTN|nr:TetR/AcrR family transcriptional regulator [Actinorhabdospora filicis]GLZ77073.1 TetR family transcriptional regulator [Actinorhabdospora filicis]